MIRELHEERDVKFGRFIDSVRQSLADAPSLLLAAEERKRVRAPQPDDDGALR